VERDRWENNSEVANTLWRSTFTISLRSSYRSRATSFKRLTRRYCMWLNSSPKPKPKRTNTKDFMVMSRVDWGAMGEKGTSAIIVTSITVVIVATVAINGYFLLKGGRNKRHLTERGPIYIDGDYNFNLANGVTSGSGTASDSYIIENWTISPSSVNSIDVRNTTLHFIIRNCLIEDGNDGIFLDNVVNAKIENNICRKNYIGVDLWSSDNITIFGNNSSNNKDGIQVYRCGNNLVYSNTVQITFSRASGSNFRPTIS
jgi:parallel beta-helix repeat protein